eukprot:4210948-Karenia_brevis.AAC.1
MPCSNNKICSVITSAAHQWLDDIGDAETPVSVARSLGSGINWCGKDLMTVALQATHIFLL